jgi:2'-5' RNA ligase
MSGNLFYSVDVSEHVKDQAEQIIASIRHTVPRATWTPREKLHMTVGFIGQAATSQCVARAIVQLDQVDMLPFHVTFRGVRHFGSRVLYAHVYEGTQFLARVHHQLTGKAVYTPHLTLAKLDTLKDREPLFNDLSGGVYPDLGTCKIDRVKLIKTTPEGYVCLAEKRLM